MSDLHPLPLVGSDLDYEVLVRAKVYGHRSAVSGQTNWYWRYDTEGPTLVHGPFDSQPEAFASAWRMVEAL